VELDPLPQRDYYRLAPATEKGSEGDKIVYHLEPLNGTLAPGDVVAVRLTVGGGEWRYLMIEDPIPAGAEFLERDDLYEIKEHPDWWGYWFSRREFHDDHAAIFQTYFNQRQTYFYLMKIVNPGKFRVSPALVELIMMPSRRSLPRRRDCRSTLKGSIAGSDFSRHV